MKKTVLATAMAASLIAVPVSEAAVPKPGTYRASAEGRTSIELKVVKAGKNGKARKVKLYKLIDDCTGTPVGGFIGGGKALKVGPKGGYSGSFGSFVSPFGSSSVSASGKFGTRTKGSVTVTSTGSGPACPGKTKFTVKRV